MTWTLLYFTLAIAASHSPLAVSEKVERCYLCSSPYSKERPVVTNVTRQTKQPINSLLRLVRIEESDAGSALYEVVCECDGSFCGTHQGTCGNIRFLHPNSFHRALACKPCAQAHGGLVLTDIVMPIMGGRNPASLSGSVADSP
jgi:hypothetical protein